MRNSLAGTAEPMQGIAEVVECFDIAGIGRQHLGIFCQCLIEAAQAGEQRCEIVVRIGRSRVLHQRAAKQVLGFLGTVELSGNDAKMKVGTEVIAVDVDDRSVKRLGLSQAAQPVKCRSPFESLLRTEAVR
jgi:hypothetical protein